MKRISVLSLSTAALLFGTGFAHAASSADKPGWYAGLDVARSNIGSGEGGIDGVFANQGISSATSISNQATGLGLNLGYRYNRFFAVEGGYIDFGKYDYNSTTTAPAADTLQGNYKANAWSLSAVGILPLDNQWSLFGKAGITDTKATLSASSASGATSVNGGSDSGTGFVAGAGATYDFAKNWFGKAELDRYAHVGNSSSTGEMNMNVFSLGVGMRF